MTMKQLSKQEETAVSSKKGDLATDLARRKLLIGAAWAAPLVLTVVSVKAYGANVSQPCEGPGCEGG